MGFTRWRRTFDEMLDRSNADHSWRLYWLNPKICRFMAHFSSVNCICGLDAWLSVRPSTSLMLAAVGRYCRPCQFSKLKFSLHQHSTVCPETSQTNVWLHNLYWLTNILLNVLCTRIKPIIHKGVITTSEWHHHHHHHRGRAPDWSVAVSTSCFHRPRSWASRQAEFRPW